jgi:hypothetical protein
MGKAAITSPAETVRQVSGQLPGQGYFLSVIAKRTYRMDPRGRCVLAPTQLPLREEIAYEENSDELVAADTDLVHWKPLTDLVVLGHGYSERPQTQLGLGIRIGTFSKLVVAIGARRACIDSHGRIVFSKPEPFTKIPLSFRFAYGGRDKVAEAKHGIPAADYVQWLPAETRLENLSPYLYPRNPCGRGYLVELSREGVEALELPQLEDPEDRLTPKRLAAGNPLRWTQMVVPQSLGWFGHAWFPRVAYFGVVPEHEPPAGPIHEVRKGWAPKDILVSGPIQERFNMRAANSASLGLQVPYLRGDEDGSLHNLSRLGPVVKFALPSERPKIWTDGRKGKLNKTEPVIHSVIIEPDEQRISIVWRGNAPALRPYSTEELATMPLRVEW